MAYFRRGYQWEQVHYLPAPVGGWNPDANTWELPQNQAPVLDNFLIRPGKIQIRGGFAVVNDLSAQAPLNLCGWVGSSTWIRLTSKAISATAFVDHWNAPLVKPAASALAKATNLSLWVPFGSAATQLGNNPVGPRSINFDGLLYGITYDAQLNANATVQDVNATYAVWKTVLYTIPQTAGSGTNVTTLPNAPQGAFDLKGYQSRIWLLGGVDTPGGGTTHSPNTLFFTIPGVSGVGTASADWRDPVSGLTNQLVMDRNTNDYGVALGVVRNGLVIFRHQSTWLLRGTTSASYVLHPISKEVGCIDARSVVECDKGVYFLSHKGLMLTDGVSIRNVSGTAENTLRLAVSVYINSALNSVGAYAHCALTSDGQILVTLGILPTASGTPNGHIQPLWCGLFDPAKNTWVRITSPIWAADGTIIQAGNNYPGAIVTPGNNQMFAVGDKYITVLENLASIGQIIAPANAGTGTDNAAVTGIAWTNPGNITAEDSTPAQADSAASPVQADPGSVTQIFGGIVWANPSDAVSDNGVFAAPSSPGAGILQTLQTSGHGFAIPTGSTILGIKLQVKHIDLGSGGAVKDFHMQLCKAGVIQATDKADTVNNWSHSATWVEYGGATDLWGTTWTPADINNANFGAAVEPISSTNGRAGIDVIRLVVYYQRPTHYLQATNFGFSVPSNATMTGIQATIKRASYAGTATIVDSEVKLLKAAAVQATNKADAVTAWPTGYTDKVYGNSTDLWGTTWTPADINNTNFGLVLSALTSGAAGSAVVDRIKITVFFTIPAAAGQSSFVQTQALYDKMADGTFQAIPATWVTRMAPLIGTTTLTRKFGQLKRFFLDYLFAANGFLASRGWIATTSNASGVAYDTAMSAAAGVTPSTSGSVSGASAVASPSIQRQNQDIVSEVDDVSFQITWTDVSRGTQPQPAVAELFGIGLEYQPTRDLK